MWTSIARFMLRTRLAIIIFLGLITAFMAFFAQKAEISYESPKLLPDHDSSAIEYKEFKKRFGQDGSVMVIGISDKDVYQLALFNQWYDLGNTIKEISGIKAVVSIARLRNLSLNDSTNKFEDVPVVSHRPTTQAELDSIKAVIQNLPFYRSFIYNDSTHATLMAITFDNKQLNTRNRLDIVDAIKKEADLFGEKSHTEVHYSGMPYIRTVVSRKIKDEMTLFMVLAFVVTAIILFVFFRSFLPVVFSIA